MPAARACLLLLLLAPEPATGRDLPVKNVHDAIAVARKICGPLLLPSYVWKASFSGGGWHARAVSRYGQILFLIDIPVRGPAATCYQVEVTH